MFCKVFHKTSILLHVFLHSYICQVIFIATIGTGLRGDIAIDDVTFSVDNCQEEIGNVIEGASQTCKGVLAFLSMIHFVVVFTETSTMIGRLYSERSCFLSTTLEI